MTVEWKLSEYSVEKWKHNENIETKTEICGTETETNFFCGSGNENGIAFSGRTDAETEVSISN
jgi:hypothetical protein